MDATVIRMVVIALSVIAALCVGGMVIAEVGDKPNSQALSLIATSCVGALVGILASQKQSGGNGPTGASGSQP